MLGRLRSIVIGRPLPTTAAAQEQLGRSRAIGAFGLDALASVIYGPDEILYVLVLAGAAGTALDLPIGLAITALLAIVVTSYRQTIFAYPQGGGSYTVARVNLGVPLGLTGAAALIIDYLANVAVSVTAGVGALIALAPSLEPHRLALALAGIVMLMVVNLRGVRDAGAVFVLPTYLFVGSLAALLAWGLLQLATGTLAAPEPQTVAATQDVSVFLVLRAFAGGCTAMTGVEAIANGVPAFKNPQSRNAARTLVTLGAILGCLFLGVVVLGQAVHANPTDAASTVSQNRTCSGRGWTAVRGGSTDLGPDSCPGGKYLVQRLPHAGGKHGARRLSASPIRPSRPAACLFQWDPRPRSVGDWPGGGLQRQYPRPD